MLAEKEQHSEEARKAFARAKGASKEAMRRKNAALEAVRRQMKQTGRGPRCSTEGTNASGAGVLGAGVPDEVPTCLTPETDRGFDGREHSSESLCRKFNCRPRQCARGGT